jgi:predicted dehydrogenase
MSLTAAAAALLSKGALRAEAIHPLESPLPEAWREPGRPVTAVVLGAGIRGNIYAAYSQRFPRELKIVGVADPLAFRRDRMGDLYGIPEERRWADWKQALEKPGLADAVIITMPDHLHYEPARRALETGYDLILEKVVAQTWKQCEDLRELARARGRIVGVGHMLRYTPAIRRLKQVIDSGRIGDVVGMRHFTPVGHVRMAHSFVRGPWRCAARSNPMLLSMAAQDMDVLRWLAGQPCRSVSAFGSKSVFNPQKAPGNAARRCTDGCALERECPYSALRIYRERKVYLGHLHLPDHEDATIMKALRQGPFGQCVFHLENDSKDQLAMNMEFGDGITASLDLAGLTSHRSRRTRVMGTLGDVVCDEEAVKVSDFRTNRTAIWKADHRGDMLAWEKGGHHGLVRDFVQAVSRRDPGMLSASLEACMESHLMGFLAEESRKQGGAPREVRFA